MFLYVRYPESIAIQDFSSLESSKLITYPSIKMNAKGFLIYEKH
jgi:hypothetical protein